RPARAVALDIGDGAAKLVLESAPVGNAEQEVGIGGGLQLLNPLQRRRQLTPEPADGRLVAASRAIRARSARLAGGSAALAALGGCFCGRPGSLFGGHQRLGLLIEDLPRFTN